MPTSIESRVPNGVDARPGRLRRIGPVVAASLTVGLIVAIVLVVLVVPGDEHAVTGAALTAFGVGWAMLAWLSVRLTDQPQRWAIVPAATMLLVGLGLLVLAPGADTMDALAWVWPPVLFALVVWMFVQSRRHLRSRTRPWLLVPVLAIMGVAAVGGGFGTLREALDRGVSRTSGRLVDVGGHRLYVDCAGSGSPTVVLESGLWQTSAVWGSIAPAVAAETRICAYDRAGHGQSEAAPGPQDGLAIAADLHALLEGAEELAPYVLVGHSSGGVYIRSFASTYLDQVAGMVLLDAQPVEAFTGLPKYPGFYRVTRGVSALFPSLARLGVSRMAFARSLRDEFAELPTALRQGAELTNLGDRPLIVVTAAAGAQAGWLPLQDGMATLSTNSLHRVLPDATHDSLLEDEGDAAMASQAILDVVQSVRSGMPLAN